MKRNKRVLYNFIKSARWGWKNTPVKTRRINNHWVLDPTNWNDRALLEDRVYEKKQIKFAEKLVSDNKVEIFLDVGANYGLYSVLFAQHPNIKEVHSFEPIDITFQKLKTNIELNENKDKCFTYNLALGETKGTAIMEYVESHSGVSKIVDSCSDLGKRREIEVNSIDNLFPNLKNKAVLMKIDVEGFQKFVLKGAREFIKNNKTYIQVEIHPNEFDSTIEQCIANNLKCFFYIGKDFYFTNQPS